MRVGLDSYSYHRLLGELRPGETDPGIRFSRGSLDVLAEARALDVDVVSLETCFLPSAADVAAGALAADAAGLDLLLAWGHPNGLEYGTSAAALADLLVWIDTAAAVGCPLVRLVAGSPRIPRPAGALALTAAALERACGAAREAGVVLALENHADLTAAEIMRLLDAVADPSLGVCFDTANALRVGDDPAAAARLLAPLVRIVHVKDVTGGAADPIGGPCSVPLGTGTVALEDVLRALVEAAFAGPLCVELGQLQPGEVDERVLVAQGVAWLRLASERLTRRRDSHRARGAEQ